MSGSPRPRILHTTATHPNVVGIKKFIVWLRGKRGQGASVRKVHDMVATEGLPAYYDPLARTASGDPRMVFDLEECQVWFETRLKRVEPASLFIHAMPLKRAR